MPDTALIGIASGNFPLIDIDLTVAVQLGIFIVVLVVGSKFLFKPYLRLREQRHDGIEGARQEAIELSAEADARLADYETKLAQARKRAQDEQRTIRADAVAHERDVSDKARAEVTKATTEASERVRNQTETARKELMPRADALAAQIASKLLGREVA